MRVQWSIRAQQDSIAIWNFIAQDNPDAADRFIDRVERKVEHLIDFPRSGRPRDEDIRAGLRSVPVGDYVIVYEVIEDAINIVRLWHGARSFKRFFDENADPD